MRALAALGLTCCADRDGSGGEPLGQGLAPGLDASGAPPAGPARSRSRRSLSDAFPALRRALPHVALGEYPTPIVAAPRLALALGVGELWLKRDDRASEVYGGGKTRKLEAFLGEALALGADTVVTFGGVGSNQAVGVARFAGRLGLRVELLLAPQPLGPHVRANLLAARAAGAELRLVPTVSGAEAAAARSSGSPTRRYVIPTGGDAAIGDLAFVDAGLELAEQIHVGACPPLERVYVALGTGGSAVGLALGLRLAGLAVPVVAVRASSPAASSAARLRAAAARTVAFARRLDPAFPDLALHADDIVLDADHLGAGYGRRTLEAERVSATAWETERLALEPVYTAKTLAAIAADAHRLRGPALLWCTQNGALGDTVAGSGRPAEPPGSAPTDLPEPLRRFAIF